MKSIKKIVLICVLLFILILLITQSKISILSNSSNVPSKILKVIDNKDIESIIIRTQRTQNYPMQVTINSKADFLEVMNLIADVEYTHVDIEEIPNGWEFWIIIKQNSKEDINISFVKDSATMNGELYQTNTKIIDDLQEIYNDMEDVYGSEKIK